MQRTLRDNLQAFSNDAVCICGITMWEEYTTGFEALETIPTTYLDCLCSEGVHDTVDANGKHWWLIVLINDYSY